jgi:threonyl-tRNA synthetase
MDISIHRHSLAHVMAQAVMELFPGTQLGIGPAIDDGFYYDFGLKEPLTSEHFGFIEDRMAKIIKSQLPLAREEYPSKEAALAAFAGQVYKEELIRDLPEDAEITAYITQPAASGGTPGFIDLCKGPHVENTRELLGGWAYKIHSVAGAYWRGSEKNPMLTRLYAYAFPTKNELKAHIAKIEEAKKRDHRKLGPQLEIFELFEEGPGFPFFLPNGMLIRNVLERFWEYKHLAAGYDEIKTPIILSESLWHRSGHWEHYQKNMYLTDIDEGDYAVKPMNCPGAMLVYKRGLHSYRELPIRLAERGLVHRHELSGALHGLLRVRCFTQDDAHIFMTKEQIGSEIPAVIRLIDDFYSTFGFTYKIELSTRPEDFMGEAADWDKAEEALKKALSNAGKSFTINEGDGAFYGPKIDFHLEDCLGRTWQCGTIQLDFQMPERFDLHYVGADGARHRPVMIHHVVLGSIERFMGILVEHFAGEFPFWLAPVQIGIVPVRLNHNDRAAEIAAILSKAGLRCKTLLEDEGMGGKVNRFRKGKVPYTLIIGDSEVEAGTVSVKIRGGAQAQNIPLDWFMAACVRLQEERALEPAEGFGG